jgi:hypothetical protein
LKGNRVIQISNGSRLGTLKQANFDIAQADQPGSLPLMEQLESKGVLVPVEGSLQAFDGDCKMIDVVEFQEWFPSLLICVRC